MGSTTSSTNYSLYSYPGAAKPVPTTMLSKNLLEGAGAVYMLERLDNPAFMRLLGSMETKNVVIVK